LTNKRRVRAGSEFAPQLRGRAFEARPTFGDDFRLRTLRKANARQQEREPGQTTLDTIAREPNAIVFLPRGAVVDLLAEVAAVQNTLVARLLSLDQREANAGYASAPAPDGKDQWITITEASKHICRSRKWFYRRADELPFIKRISPKALLVSRQGLDRWIERQRGQKESN
jgi:hypothetical protein